MELESGFDFTSSTGGKGGISRKGGISVWQAQLALRMSFLRKVYGILAAQLLLTVAVCALYMYVPSVRSYAQQSPVLALSTLVVTVIVLLALMYKRHDSPMNYCLLLAFTVLESVSLGTIVTYYDQSTVFEAFFITAVVFMALTSYTMQSKYDFSTWGASLFSFLLVLIVAGLFQLIFGGGPFEMVLSVGGALLFCGYIIFDTHLIMHKLSPEDYIVASVNLYLDVINLFLYVLRILDALKK
ncbi:hypothetical protein EMCRGX_G033282 [Ephydatia muelleri]